MMANRCVLSWFIESPVFSLQVFQIKEIIIEPVDARIAVLNLVKIPLKYCAGFGVFQKGVDLIEELLAFF